MRRSSPFSEDYRVSYEKVGRPPKKKYKQKDIYNLIQSKPASKEEIEMCLTCPYPDCVAYCSRLKNLRKEQAKKNGK